ncbi:metallo-beta-lactamase domain protein [delta proteobacterium NaphS2]|nr:metallo-beta-lactamase domain protein [delta proteobacterium NaphS2]
MNQTKIKPAAITPNFHRIGTVAFPAFLSMGKVGMIIEGGTGPTSRLIVQQIKSLGIDMQEIEYILLTHTHADHIGALPHLKRRWPHLKIVASGPGANILNTQEFHNEFLLVDLGLAQLMRAKSEIDDIPPTAEDYRFEVDLQVKGGDALDLGDHVTWEIIDTPGHSPCHISAYEPGEKTLMVGDATGFYVPEKDIFWPNYFFSLKGYVESIQKLSTFPAERAILSHNAVIEGDVHTYLEKAITATRHYHETILKQLNRGNSAESIALEGAQFVSSLTDIQPFKVNHDLCKQMINRSRETGEDISFSLEGKPSRSSDEVPFRETDNTKELVLDAEPVEIPKTSKELNLGERLSLVALIDEGMRSGLAEAPVSADLFDNLWELVGATAKGGRINRLKFNDAQNGFQMFEIKAETGENLARLNMIYLKKPIPCYYLVYVEVAAPFRRKGLGNQILISFADFLTEKSAVGILDNIIPQDDPTNAVYLKHSWIPVEDIIGDLMVYKDNNYMVFIPPSMKNRDLKQSVLKLMYHLKRKRGLIDIRENETMVKKTLNEFRELYQALMTYFHPELEGPRSSVFMRFLFTRFVTKFIAFRRRIGDLVGYTGGESTEQIVLDARIDKLQVKSYAPRELAKEDAIVMGSLGLLSKLPEELKQKPAQVIESLPNYRRPNFLLWLEKHNKTYEDTLTLGDLMDLGFDPTRLKEIEIDEKTYIFERVQARQIHVLEERRDLVARISHEMPNTKIKSAQLKTNPILLIIRDLGNGYVLRRKIDAIHWEEAIEQLQSNPSLKSVNEAVKLDRIIMETVKTSATTISNALNVERKTVIDQLTPFVSWDLVNNRPKMVIDFSFSYVETIWIA